MNKFEIENILSTQTDKPTGDKLVIKNDFADAEIYLLGGHLTHFQPKGEERIIFDGKESYIHPPKSAHFGIPICWPWFGPHLTDSTKSQHGFARNSLWNIKETKDLLDGQTLVVLQLEENEKTLALYPHTFKLELTFTIGKTLHIALKTYNTSKTSMQITQALHSYFFVADIENICIKGLEGKTFIDQLDNHTYKKEKDSLEFTNALDRIYIPTTDTCQIVDTKLKRKIIVEKEHSHSTVVWNPWENNNLHDVEGTKYKNFICIETAKVKEDKVTLKAGESYTLIQKISLENL